jgi:hypothetical protein
MEFDVEYRDRYKEDQLEDLYINNILVDKVFRSDLATTFIDEARFTFLRSLFWERRTYKLSNDGGSTYYFEYRWVVIKPPEWYYEQLCEPTTYLEDNTVLLTTLSPTYTDLMVNRDKNSTIGPLFYNNVLLSFAEYAMTQGICPDGHSFKWGNKAPWHHIVTPELPVGTEYRKRFRYRLFDIVEPSSTVSHGVFRGEFLTREKHSQFSLDLYADLDLSKAQVTDLLIFSERLITALRKKSKS